MGISATGISVPALGQFAAGVEAGAGQRQQRRISPQAGHALEMLGHAIEYLADEFVHEGGAFSAHDPRVEAVQLLMARNREIYFECPEIPSFGDRVRGWLHLN